MSTGAESDEENDIPWQQRLYERVWLLAIAAIVFFALSYVVWGIIDIISIPAG